MIGLRWAGRFFAAAGLRGLATFLAGRVGFLIRVAPFG